MSKTLVFYKKRGMIEEKDLPSPLLLARWTYAINQGIWFWVNYDMNNTKEWAEIPHNYVPKKFRTTALILG